MPDIRETVTRAEWIRFRYQDLEGKWEEVRWEGLMARVVQHEWDHLDGVLFVDRINVARRALLAGKLKQMSREQ